jgi:hypothetical protein
LSLWIDVVLNNYAGEVKLHDEQIAGHHNMTDTYKQQQDITQ